MLKEKNNHTAEKALMWMRHLLNTQTEKLKPMIENILENVIEILIKLVNRKIKRCRSSSCRECYGCISSYISWIIFWYGNRENIGDIS